MRETAFLCAHHIGRMIKFNWFAKGKIKVLPTKSERILKRNGFDVVSVSDVLKPNRKKEKPEFIGFYDKDEPLNENHPDYKSECCFFYKDDNVLLEGLQQAKVLTNTVELSNALPQSVMDYESNISLPNWIHSEVKKRIMVSCVFESTQEKLPKRKDPARPAWNFPRDYGITNARKSELLCKNLLGVCEQIKNIEVKGLIENAFFSVPFKAFSKNIQFEMTSELLLMTKKKISKMVDPCLTSNISLPNLFPLDCTISLIPSNYYVLKDIYPVNMNLKWPHIQIAFAHYDETQVKNIYGEKVLESQIEGRSLLKGFSIAVAESRAMFGNDISNLPEPVVIPVIQTDGKKFYFSIFQLNTLEIDANSEVKNIFWRCPPVSLYDVCQYEKGKPILEGYNPEVIQKLLTFYNIK